MFATFYFATISLVCCRKSSWPTSGCHMGTSVSFGQYPAAMRTEGSLAVSGWTEALFDAWWFCCYMVWASSCCMCSTKKWTAFNILNVCFSGTPTISNHFCLKWIRPGAKCSRPRTKRRPTLLAIRIPDWVRNLCGELGTKRFPSVISQYTHYTHWCFPLLSHFLIFASNLEVRVHDDVPFNLIIWMFPFVS